MLGTLVSTTAFSDPTIKALKGVDSLAVKVPDGQTALLKVGDDIPKGSHFELPKKAYLMVAYANGFKVYSRAGTKFTVDEAAIEGKTDAPLIRLDKGEIRSSRPEQAEKANFYVETKVAVVGVRGTDFIVNSTGNSTDVRTFHGRVEVARNFDRLREGDSRSLVPGERLQAHSKGELPKVQKFDLQKERREYEQRNPEFNRFTRDLKDVSGTREGQDRMNARRQFLGGPRSRDGKDAAVRRPGPDRPRQLPGRKPPPTGVLQPPPPGP